MQKHPTTQLTTTLLLFYTFCASDSVEALTEALARTSIAPLPGEHVKQPIKEPPKTEEKKPLVTHEDVFGYLHTKACGLLPEEEMATVKMPQVRMGGGAQERGGRKGGSNYPQSLECACRPMLLLIEMPTLIIIRPILCFVHT